MPTGNGLNGLGGHGGHNGHNGLNGGGPLPPDGMYHVSDSIAGGDGIGEKVNIVGGSDGSEESATGVGLYRRLPSSTCV